MVKYLSDAVYNRLADCRNLKSDLQELTDAMWKDFQDKGKDKNGFTKEDALISVLDWLDNNSQDFDLTREEYDELIK
jgi:ubiquinone biosynthesis protein COQ9